MKKKILIGLALLASLAPSAKAILNVGEADGSPILPDVRYMAINGATLSDTGNGTISFSIPEGGASKSELNAGNIGSIKNFNFSNALHQRGTLNGASATINFTNPSKATEVTLRLLQDSAAGNGIVATWNANILWAGNTPPNLSNGYTATDLLRCYFDGTSYNCNTILNLQ